jgi:hypothetical protein
MRPNPVRISLLAAALIALPGVAIAQFPPPPPPPGTPAPAPSTPPPIEQRWPAPQQPSQPQPCVETPPPSTAQTPPAPAPRPKPAPKTATKPKPAPKVAAKPKPAHHATPSYAVVCSGVFAKDTNHHKLAVKYDSHNIAYTDVDGPGHTKLKATVLFPRDPKRRLEVLWHNDASRSDVQVISINGRSHWTAPKGLKLGLSLAALEKLNRRPFKLTGFGPEGNASVLDWQGGALASLPGGCKVGIRLHADRRTPAAARAAVTGNKELLSSNAALKSVKADIAEILLGY